MGEDRVRVTRLGLIGLGTWGQRYVDTIARRSDCRIAAFATLQRADARTIPGAQRCGTWQDVLEMARRGALDALVAATNPLHQAEVAVAAAAAGVPLLVEKPLGLSEQDAQRVLQEFQQSRARAPILVDYVHLFAPAYRRLKDLVQTAGGRDSIAAVESIGANQGPFRAWSPLWDYGPHDLALCLDLLSPGCELIEARRLPGRGKGELIRASFTVGAIPFIMTVGNGADRRSRRFAVTLQDGRTLTYDDCQPQSRKLVDGDVAVIVDETRPLDAVLTHFLSECRLWAKGDGALTEGSRWLELSVRIAGVLDGVALALRPAG